jgi:hypothetical protein
MNPVTYSITHKVAPKFDDQNIWNSTPAPIAVYAKKEVPEL